MFPPVRASRRRQRGGWGFSRGAVAVSLYFESEGRNSRCPFLDKGRNITSRREKISALFVLFPLQVWSGGSRSQAPFKTLPLMFCMGCCRAGAAAYLRQVATPDSTSSPATSNTRTRRGDVFHLWSVFFSLSQMCPGCVVYTCINIFEHFSLSG